jgi:hypothetical protein
MPDQFLGNGSENTFPLQRLAYENECCYLRGPCRGVIKKRLGQPGYLIVGSKFCTGLEHGSRRIATVMSRYQETSSEDTAVRKRLSVCNSDL